METISNRDKISLGRGKGVEILKAIKNAKESVKIVSPYLTPTYLSELVKLRQKDIPITLITCDNLEEDKYGYSHFSHKDVIKQKKITDSEVRQKKKKIRTATIVIFIMALIMFLLSAFFLAIFLTIAGVVMLILNFSIKDYEFAYHSIFRLKIFDSKSGKSPRSTNLVHAKIFVIDDKIAYLGSANFTWSGFRTHYETIIKIEDPKAIKDIIDEVENLFNSQDLKFWSIDDWGKEIYE